MPARSTASRTSSHGRPGLLGSSNRAQHRYELGLEGRGHSWPWFVCWHDKLDVDWPVLDYVTGNVFVGCSDGKLYGLNSSGVALSHASVTVGDGTASETYGGIVDPPMVDGVNGFVYAVSGSANGGAYGALVQAKTDLSSSVVAQIGAGNQCNMHAPDFNNAYYTSPTTAGALIYVAGVTGTVSQPCTASSSTTGDIYVYGVTLGAGGIMTSGTPADSFSAGGGPGAEWAPLLEFYNPNTAIDWLFAGANQSNQTNLGSANITAGFPGGVGTVVTEGLGPSGMIVATTAHPRRQPAFISMLCRRPQLALTIQT